MKSDQKLIDGLNELLLHELTAINQYMVHGEMDENWGYDKLYESVRKRAFEEMRHAETLIERILFLEGRPIVSKLENIHIGATVDKQLENDLKLEIDCVRHYGDVIALAGDLKDFSTRDILVEIMRQEDKHIDTLEEYRDQIDQMTLPLFLSTQS